MISPGNLRGKKLALFCNAASLKFFFFFQLLIQLHLYEAGSLFYRIRNKLFFLKDRWLHLIAQVTEIILLDGC